MVKNRLGVGLTFKKSPDFFGRSRLFTGVVFLGGESLDTLDL